MDEKWRILVVDDDQDILDLVYECLSENYDVLILKKSSVVQTAIEQFQPDLAILDIMMPKVNGYQIAQFIKNHREYKHIPVLFLSAKQTQNDMKMGYQKGADYYLTKPFQPDRLIKNVDLIFERTPPKKTRKNMTFNEVKLRMEFFSDDGGKHTRYEDVEKEKEEGNKQSWMN